MTEYSPGPESDSSPAKMMAIMIVVALLAAGFFAMAVMIDRKSPDPMYDATDSTHHTQSQLEMTPDLWMSKHPVDDLNAPPLESATAQPAKPKPPITKPPTPPPSNSQPPTPSTNPS
jgi:outer membrane biosynthesis protein TonB